MEPQGSLSAACLTQFSESSSMLTSSQNSPLVNSLTTYLPQDPFTFICTISTRLLYHLMVWGVFYCLFNTFIHLYSCPQLNWKLLSVGLLPWPLHVKNMTRLLSKCWKSDWLTTQEMLISEHVCQISLLWTWRFRGIACLVVCHDPSSHELPSPVTGLIYQTSGKKAPLPKEVTVIWGHVNLSYINV